jgi:hypothetical protein
VDSTTCQIFKYEVAMEVKLKRPVTVTVNTVKSVDKLMILVYNLLLLAGASYLVVVHNVTSWVYLIALIFGASWSEKDKEE